MKAPGVMGTNTLAVAVSATLSCLAFAGAARAAQWPVGGTPRACATYLEWHGEPHVGIDIPEGSAGSLTSVHTVRDEELAEVCLNGQGLTPVLLIPDGQQDVLVSAAGWSLDLVPDADGFAYLDVLSVKRVTNGKGPVDYQVSSVEASATNHCQATGRVYLTANYPSSADEPVADDVLRVTYAYRLGSVDPTIPTPGSLVFFSGESSVPYVYYNHIQDVADFINWTEGSPTDHNRLYGALEAVPDERVHLLLAENTAFANIYQDPAGYWSEPNHLHLETRTTAANDHASEVNPLTCGLFTDPTMIDPNGQAPRTGPILLLDTYTGQTISDTDQLLTNTDVDIVLECRDDMGSQNSSGSGTRDVGCFNAAYWITQPLNNDASVVGSSGSPVEMIDGGAVDRTTDFQSCIHLSTQAPYFVDPNSYYYLNVSHAHNHSGGIL